MKAITKFLALDGAEFATEKKCRAYESMSAEVAHVMAILPPVSIKGAGFVQLERAQVLAVQRALVRIFQREVPYLANDPHTLWALAADRPAGMTLIGRYMDDAAPGPLRAAWCRIMRIDNQYREYEQPYYAIQADKLSDAE